MQVVVGRATEIPTQQELASPLPPIHSFKLFNQACLPFSTSLPHLSAGNNCQVGMSGKNKCVFNSSAQGRENTLRLMAEYPDVERNENGLGATEICNVRLMCLVRSTDMSYESTARR